ncbi:hypothetical protein F4801DRAFT_290150 [Xylaria longipes]|nr:hypothetical protein F4801DRAFT_290150 [Xylaria longipes]
MALPHGPEDVLYYLPPGTPYAPIRLTSQVCNLTTQSYKYISFGGSRYNRTVAISLDNEEKSISEPFANLLRGVMSTGWDMFFWVDGLHQLDPEDRDRKLRNLIRFADNTWCMLGTPRSTAVTAKMGIAGALRNALSQGVRRIDEPMWADIEAMFGSTYWCSIHCIAEVALGHRVAMRWGDWGIDFRDYISAFRALTYLRHEEIPLKPCSTVGWQVAVNSSILKYMVRRCAKIDFRHSLHIARLCPSASAMNPIDMICVMDSISTPWRKAPSPSPDHAILMSVRQAFVEAARDIVLDRQDLSIWDYERPPCLKRIEGLPTWVPDFSADAAQRGVQFPVRNGLHLWGNYFMRAHKRIRCVIFGIIFFLFWQLSEYRLSFWNQDGAWKVLKHSRITLKMAITDFECSSVSNEHLIVQMRPMDCIVWNSPIINAGNAAQICVHLYRNLQSPKDEPRIFLVDRLWRTLVLNHIEHEEIRCISLMPSYQMYESFLCFLMEAILQVSLGGHPCEVLTGESWELAPNYNSYWELTRLGRNSEPFRELLRKNAYGRQFFTTLKGRFGMSAVMDVNCVGAGYEAYKDQPLGTACDTSEYENKVLIVACLGGRFPYIVQETGKTLPGDPSLRCFVYCGECYLHGAMEGEDFKVPDERGQRVFSSNADLIRDVAIV